MNMIRILCVVNAAQFIVNKNVDARKLTEGDPRGVDAGEPEPKRQEGDPIREFSDIPPRDIETFNGEMKEDGMFEHISCDKTSGACYHLDNGNVEFDRTMRINDYRRMYSNISNNSENKEVGNNHINVNVLQTIQDHGEKINNIRHDIESHVSDKLTLHALVIIACVFTPIAIAICIKIAIHYYREYCQKGAAQKRARKEVLEAMEGLFEENPDHVLNLLKFLLTQYNPTFCNQFLKKEEAKIAKRIHQQATDEEMKELVEASAAIMGLHPARPYSTTAVNGTAPHMY